MSEAERIYHQKGVSLVYRRATPGQHPRLALQTSLLKDLRTGIDDPSHKENDYPTSVTGLVALRSKWPAGKAVRAGLAPRRSLSGPFDALSLAQGIRRASMGGLSHVSLPIRVGMAGHQQATA